VIPLHGKRVDLALLDAELTAAGVPHHALGTQGTGDDVLLHTYDAGGLVAGLPPEAQPVVDAHMAPPLVIEYAQQQDISAIVRTTNATVLEVFRFPCEPRHLYRASLRIAGVDTDPSMVSLIQEGRFVWKRPAAAAVLDGVTVVSQIPTAIPSGWATNCFAQGIDIVFTVKGPAGRVIDWLLVGDVGTYAPEGL
jgi:hypothetical protein